MIDIMIPLLDDYKNIFFIKGGANGKSPFSHSLLIEDFLIDTGISPRHIRLLKRNHIEINNIILSHWHQDHINGNRFFQDKSFLAHYEERFILENFNNNFALNMGISNLDTKRWVNEMIKSFRICDIEIDTCFSDEDIIKIGDDLKLKVIHTPGHSKGHCCFLELNSKILFLADIVPEYGPWYAGIDSNLIELENSIKKIKKLKFNIAISSHRGIMRNKNTVLHELETNQNIIINRDQKILEYFSEKCPITIRDLTNKNIINNRYSKIDHGYTISIEKNMIEKHLNRFLKKEIIRFEKGGYILQ